MIVPTDIKFKYSVVTGSAGNSLPQADPNSSLGGYVSTTQWSGGTLHDLFNLVTSAENAANQIDYRCVFVHNTNGTNTLTGPVVWFSGSVAGGANSDFGIDGTAASVASASSTQAVIVANGTTAPIGVSFSNPTSFGAGVALGDLPPNYVRALWFRRSAVNSPALNNDGFTISVQGDTTA